MYYLFGYFFNRGGKEESKSVLTQFYKELDSETHFKGEESTLRSGDIAIIILIQRRIKKWMSRGKALHELKYFVIV